jgi:hypothetical protein
VKKIIISITLLLILNGCQATNNQEKNEKFTESKKTLDIKENDNTKENIEDENNLDEASLEFLDIQKYTFEEFEKKLQCENNQERGCFFDDEVKSIMNQLQKLKIGKYPTSEEEWNSVLISTTGYSLNYHSTLDNYNGFLYFTAGGCCDFLKGNIDLAVIIVDNNNIYYSRSIDFWSNFTMDEILNIDNTLSPQNGISKDNSNFVYRQFIGNFEGEIIDGTISEKDQEKFITNFREIKKSIENGEFKK